MKLAINCYHYCNWRAVVNFYGSYRL